MKYVQVVECHCKETHSQEVRQVAEYYLAETKRQTGLEWAVLLSDRNKADTYVVVAEFITADAYERNNALLSTQQFALKLGLLCAANPSFRSFDVIDPEIKGT